MKITVINGTEKQGVTYALKEIFLARFVLNAEITEFYLPKDCPNFCSGCTSCFVAGESVCKDYEYVHRIEESLLNADLIVITSPAYVMHVTGALKAYLDHMAYRWMPHRPSPEMFAKRAVIISQCAGAGAKSTVTDIKHSLSWWGISEIGVFTGALMSEIIWNKLPEKRRGKLTKKIVKLADKYAKINYSKPARVSVVTKIKFGICRLMQKKLYASNSEYKDACYWYNLGWLNRVRPWRRQRKSKKL